MTTRIGKDVIESLTQAMYEDSRFIYREYIQNSADQIDKAVNLGILKKSNDGNITIDIDKNLKRISIMDNATGIEAECFIPLLKNVAKSPKDRATDKGFRGIGRLGGLAYCDRLVFETSFRGENVKSIMVWNAQKLKDILNDRASHEDAAEVIDSIVDVIVEKEDPASHFFNVIMHGVSNDILLDKENIKEYLSMVAPVPFNSITFKYADKIYSFVKENNLKIDEYRIFVNSDLIKKAYTNYLYNGNDKGKKFKYDEILDIEFKQFFDHHKTLLAWGWFSISSFNGFIPTINLARGIRLRKGNIQIGLEDCLEKFHKEKRGNSYYYGEIHAVDTLLIPNSRRDFFVENSKVHYFSRELRTFFSDQLYKYYHLASDIRSKIKPIRKTIELKLELKEKDKKGFKSKEEKTKLQDQFNDAKDKGIRSEENLKKIARKVFNNTTEKKILSSVLKKEIDDISDNLNGQDNEVKKMLEAFPQVVKNTKDDLFNSSIIERINYSADQKKIILVTDKLNVSSNNRKIVEKIIEIIDNALPKDLSKSLIQKIVEELK